MRKRSDYAPDTSLELYVHIPFCVKKCNYCDFLSGPASPREQEVYFEALLNEIQNVKEGTEAEVVSVFIGGGTPSLPEEGHICRVMEKLHQKFKMAPDAEITIEANPGTLSERKLNAYRRSGINRLSLGLQSVKEKELQMLGRIHTMEDFRKNYILARETGFANINVDLMSALPGQSCRDWEENLRTVAELGPEHISAYSLIIEEGTVFARQKLDLPDEDTEYRMYEDTAAILAEYGYRQYEISNYALPGRECLHNVGYWKRRNYLGFGLGAASLYNGVRFSNTSDREEYIRGILGGNPQAEQPGHQRPDIQEDLQENAGPAAIRRNVEILTEQDAMAEFCFLGLRMMEGVSREEFTRQFGCSMEDVYGPVIQKHKALGLLAEENGRIRLTRTGIHVSNSIMADFLL